MTSDDFYTDEGDLISSGPLLTRDDLARFFGVATNTITRWCREGLLKRVKLNGSHVRFVREDVIEMVRRNRGYADHDEEIGAA